MSEHAEEKQHEASGKKLADMRKQGKVLRSKDLSSALLLAGSIIFLGMTSDKIYVQFQMNFYKTFELIGSILQNGDDPFRLLKILAIANFKLLLPLFMFCVFIAFITPFIFGGWNFSLESLAFNFERLDPINNLKNIFSTQLLFNIGFSFLKVVLIFSSVLILVFMENSKIMHLPELTHHSATMVGSHILHKFVIVLSLSVLVLAAVDMFYHYRSFYSQSKMSLQEVKDEQKDLEGSSLVKRKIRSRQLALLKQRLSITVPRANVIITNPTHYSVAIAYQRNMDKAPRVVAKGKGPIAKQIRAIAASKGITIHESPQLARALYHTTKIGAEIHPGLYMAVAIVLSYVFQLKNYQMGLGAEPRITDNLDIPKEFIFNE